MVNLKIDYILLLIDVKNSTSLPAKEINNKMSLLEKQLKVFNETYKSNLALPLTLSYGDEIAALLKTTGNIYSIISAVRKIFYPLTSVRFTVTRGRIAYQSADIRKVGGPIFKKASQAMMELKEKNGFCKWQLGQEITDNSLISLCEISNALIDDMSSYQRGVFELLATGHTQKQISEALNKYPQSVFDAIQRSKAHHIIYAEKTIELILSTNK